MEKYLYAQVPPQIIRNSPETSQFYKVATAFNQFPFIKEFGKIEFTHIQPNSLGLHYNLGIEVCYIHKGKYHWQSDGQGYVLLPGDCFITFPWQKHGSSTGFADIGIISWMIILPEIIEKNGEFQLGVWSQLTEEQEKEIGNTFISSQRNHFTNKNIGQLFERIHRELKEQSLGFTTLIHASIDELFIQMARSISNSTNTSHTPENEAVTLLKNAITKKLCYKWCIADMTQVLGLGQTSLNLLLKRVTGLSPGQFLMDIRISEAKTMMKDKSKNLTSIAFDCGFSSSQHFSKAFRMKTGESPKKYRKSKQ